MKTRTSLAVFAALVSSCSASGERPEDDVPDIIEDTPTRSDVVPDVGVPDVVAEDALVAEVDGLEPILPGALGEPCTESGCEAGTVCAEDTCVPTLGACDEGECGNDAYCCGDACDDPEACVPYGWGPRGDVDQTCTGRLEIGVFEPSMECEWTGPGAEDPFPEHRNVLGTPLVANSPHDSKYGAEIFFVSYNHNDGGSDAAAGVNPDHFGVIRILDGESCQLQQTIDSPDNRVIAASPLAIADLDADGDVEIVAQRAVTGLIAFTWDPESEGYVPMWVSTESDITASNRWDGPALHDLDDDGLPEVISGGEVFNGLTGTRLNPGQSPGGPMAISVVADLDQDGAIELIAEGKIFHWDPLITEWVLEFEGVPTGTRTHYGYGDFGTDGEGAENFDRETRDGIAEIVTAGNERATIVTLDGDILLDVGGITGGGPPTVGDFDNDGRAEFASAGGNAFRVFDPDCDGPGLECIGAGVRWTTVSQDLSSRTTGSSIFDFEQDGRAEAVYGDECYTRIYDGDRGTVLYSAFRTSCTWYENPIVADPDRDGNAEIVVGANDNCNVTCPDVDPIHRGLRCELDEDCPAAGLGCVDGLCRCDADDQCTSQTGCVETVDTTDGPGNVCRAVHPPGASLVGIQVLRDRLDRWASSRPIWNQHAFATTNISDDGLVPRTSSWIQPFTIGGPNAFRANAQGGIGNEAYPDATSRLEPTLACRRDGPGANLTGMVCNRGGRPIGAGMPAVFADDDPDLLCETLANEQLPPGACLEVTCRADRTPRGELRLIANIDAEGAASTIECLATNNESAAFVSCE